MDPIIENKMTPKILEQFAKAYAITLNDLHYHDSTESFLYRYSKENNDYFLRISHSDRRTPEQIKGELDWLDWLKTFHLPTVQVAQNMNGENCSILPLEDGGYFTAVSFHKLSGQQRFDLFQNPLHIEQLGKIMGQMHQAAQTYQPKNPTWKRPDCLEETEGFAQKYLPPSEQKAIALFDVILGKIEELPRHKNNFGLIHFDLHPGNLFIDQGKLSILDFDDCQYNHFVGDIAISLFYGVPFQETEQNRNELAKRFLDHLLKGYTEIRSISQEELQWIPLFLKYREIDLYTVIHRTVGQGPYDDSWTRTYMENRKDRIEQEIPFFQNLVSVNNIKNPS